LDDVSGGFGELGVVENVGVAVEISLKAHPVSEMQSTSGFVTAVLIYGSRSCRTRPLVTLLDWSWWKMLG
jgi:hypothetical protein